MHLKELLVYVYGHTINKNIILGTSASERSGDRAVKKQCMLLKLNWYKFTL